jgi:hypothetical protein
MGSLLSPSSSPKSTTTSITSASQKSLSYSKLLSESEPVPEATTGGGGGGAMPAAFAALPRIVGVGAGASGFLGERLRRRERPLVERLESGV